MQPHRRHLSAAHGARKQSRQESRHASRRHRLPLLALAIACCCGGALVLAACQKPAPVAEQPKRKSFEDSNWHPIQASAPAAAPAVGGSNGAGTTPQDIQHSWQQAHDAQGDAAKTQAASDALNKTQALADQSNQSNPH